MTQESGGGLTRAERTLSLWMLLSAWTYAFGAVFFFLAGKHISAVINYIAERLLPFLPLYPLPDAVAEGAFWRVLSVSMMAMLAWVCFNVRTDVRGRVWLVPVVLLSKCCSTSCYFLLFIGHPCLAYLVGVLTDGPIFLVTWALWFQAKNADRYLDAKEEAVLLAVGDALMPRGGAFQTGFADVAGDVLADTRRLLAAQNAATLFMTRVMLHVFNVLPLLFLRPRTFLRMTPEERGAFLACLESHPVSAVRALCQVLKLHTMLPFFNQPEAEKAVSQPEGEEA
ncbi:MAG: hypothetical protein H3C30_05840 [Candidatus Hydrogenedentes bacterium]|nr:hypothetical protein [Candidatus Hydrogenedentota bacterium]